MGKQKGKGKHQVPAAAKTAGQPAKTPRIGEDVDFWRSSPQWSFTLLDLAPEIGGWLHLRQGEVDALLARFREWETMTWGEILAEGGRKRNHWIDVNQCCAESQKRLKYLRLDDHEQLLSLAVGGQARVIGILDRATFRILWWDPGHKVCPAQLRHT